jgi:hypothetical protein
LDGQRVSIGVLRRRWLREKRHRYGEHDARENWIHDSPAKPMKGMTRFLSFM